ncbi:MAG: ATP-binding cassette domain-containing protein [Acidobacteria bacterium]|nr:ATP-binding cassette domain-containing protein [Acidobacteriota bacterium]
MSIVLEDLAKFYEGHAVVSRVSVEIGDGELFVLLGPSGSGKSTILRMIAGLTAADHGRIVLHGRDVTLTPAQKRGVGFVFQHYALFKHMTVAENVGFALSIRRAAEAERRRRVEELLGLVGLSGFGGRMPGQLSGGQQQRVALARALAHRPSVLLMDEPFGALDARIRSDLRRTIRAVQRELGVTTIFVTHDQEEAFELADRIGVMTYGRLLEVGSPQDLYLRPRTEFAATFLGRANLMIGVASGGEVRVGGVSMAAPLPDGGAGATRRVQVLFRPEDVLLRESREAIASPVLGQGTVEERIFSGTLEKLTLRLPPLPGVRQIAPAPAFGGDHLRVEALRSQDQALRHPLKPGESTWVGVRRIHTLAHPGLSLLILLDGTPGARAALAFAAQLARLAHPTVSLLAIGEADQDAEIRRAREVLAGANVRDARTSREITVEAIASGAEPYDIIVAGLPARDLGDSVERLLRASDAHLLLVPGERVESGPPARVLVSAAVGEPGKQTILFAGRVVRHFGAEIRILTVLSPGAPDNAAGQAERFLAAGVTSLKTIGVPSRGRPRRGAVAREVGEELAESRADLLVLGAPIQGGDAELRLSGAARELIEHGRRWPILVVRSGETARTEVRS